MLALPAEAEIVFSEPLTADELQFLVGAGAATRQISNSSRLIEGEVLIYGSMIEWVESEEHARVIDA